jgi:hypothetical protein
MTEEIAGNWDLMQDTEEGVLKSSYKLSHFSTFRFGVLISRFKCFLYSAVEVVHYAKGAKIWLFIIYFMFKQ